MGFAVRYPFPEIRDEVPENFSRTKFSDDGLRGLNGFRLVNVDNSEQVACLPTKQVPKNFVGKTESVDTSYAD